jgi:hypothetical protein
VLSPGGLFIHETRAEPADQSPDPLAHPAACPGAPPPLLHRCASSLIVEREVGVMSRPAQLRYPTLWLPVPAALACAGFAAYRIGRGRRLPAASSARAGPAATAAPFDLVGERAPSAG